MERSSDSNYDHIKIRCKEFEKVYDLTYLLDERQESNYKTTSVN